VNLGQIRASVEKELQYAPDLLDWRQDARAGAVAGVYESVALDEVGERVVSSCVGHHAP